MKKYLTRDHFWLALKYLFIALLFGFVIRGFLLIPLPVKGNSMEQTLNQGDMVIMEKYSSIKRFDVIVFKKQGIVYIKRVIGLPGEQVSYQNDRLQIDDKKLAEPFLRANLTKDHEKIAYTPDFSLAEVTGKTKVPAKNYFVLGDNRRISKDSRSFGTVKSSEILGKARFVYYPIRDLKIISRN